MIFAGLAMARRLEAAEAVNGMACAEAQAAHDPVSGATALEVGGGVAIYVGRESPLSHVIGLGMRGPVRAEDIDRLEDFYSSRGAAVSVDVCPLADPSLIELLGNRAYRLTEFNNVLVRPLPGDAIGASEVAVRPAGQDEEELWARTVGRGFLEKDELSSEEMDVGRNIFLMRGSLCYLAIRTSKPVAAAAMTARHGLAMLFADSTVPGFRGAGLHAGLIRERLREAVARGCDMASASTLPGSVSQRNYERNGFQVAYTKAILVGE